MTAAANPFDEFPELAPRQGIDPGGGLVKNQQLRIVDQRTAQTQFLFHAAGEFSSRTVCKGSQAGAIEQLLDAPGPLIKRLAEQSTEEIDVLEYRQRQIKIAS